MIQYEDDTKCLSEEHIMWMALDRKLKPPKNRHFTDRNTRARISSHLKKCKSCREKFKKYREETGLIVNVKKAA